MFNQKRIAADIAKGAMLAAIYVAISLIFTPLSYGPVQIRFAEALVPLATLSPFAAVGLVVGCFITNLFSPFGLIDIVFGTLGTVSAVSLGYLFRKVRVLNFPIASAFCAVLTNALILGPVLCYFELGRIDLLFAGGIALQIAVGQIISCTLLAYPIFRYVEKSRVLTANKPG